MRTIGFDLGGSKLLACLTDEHGRVLRRAVRPTGRATGPLDACGLMIDAARELEWACGPFSAAGIGFPGLVDFTSGRVLSSIILDHWHEVPLAQQMAQALGVPCVVDNDVNCAAVAELSERQEEGVDAMLFVAVGTGIGGAIVIGNRLWRGHSGVAGEIGNVTIDRHGATCWCGRRGCLNTSASGAAIERQLDPEVSLAEQVRREHPRLDMVVAEAARSLGIGIANALNLLNPGLVVLGGGVAELGQVWLDQVSAAARSEAFPEAARCRIELARAGYEAGAIGAALLAQERFSTETPAQHPYSAAGH
jgi:glucokinase